MGAAKKNQTCTTDPNNDRCHGCDGQCHDGSKAHRYKVDISTHVQGGLDGVDEKKVKTEIFKHGSVMGGLSVYSNWGKWVKTHGPDVVYTSHENSAHVGAHSIKIIGYGVSHNVKYWLVQNSWGANFGDHGTIKMLRGENTSMSGGDRIIWNQAAWAMPILSSSSDEEEEESEVSFEEDFSADNAADASVLAQTGGWSQGDHTHSFWRDLAQQVFALSGVKGKFVAIEGVETQVIAGFNARFTVRTTDGFRAVIASSHGIEHELLAAPVLESLIELD